MMLADLARYDRDLGARDGAADVRDRGRAYAAGVFAELEPEHVGPAYAVGYLEGMCSGRRECIRCRVDLTDVMGVYVFVTFPRDPRRVPRMVATRGPLLCVSHGSGTGANVLTLADARDYLTGVKS